MMRVRKNSTVFSRYGKALALLVFISFVVGCGKEPDAPAPTPPPPPSNPTPAPPPGPVFGGCGAPTSPFPLSPVGNAPAPFRASLYGQNSYGYGGSSGANLELSLFYQNLPAAGEYEHSVIGFAALTLNDLGQMYGSYNVPAAANRFCINTLDTTGALVPGRYSPIRRFAFEARMQGTMQVPLLSPYSGYPGGYIPGNTNVPLAAEFVEAILRGYLANGRFDGEVVVTIGRRTTLYYVTSGGFYY